MLVKLGQGMGKKCGTGEAPPPSLYLDGAIASACCDLDATVASSYAGSGQTWANLVAAPADGAAKTAYDFHLGADGSAGASDPAFTGSAGSAAAYFALDGGDYFTLKDQANAPTLYNLHKKSGGTNKWWIACAYQSGTDGAMAAWGRGFNGTGHGMYLWRSSSNTQLYQWPGGLLQALGVNQAQATDYLVIVSADMEATSNNVRWWINTTTGTTASKTWGSDSTNASTEIFRIGAAGEDGAEGIMSNGSRYYHFSCGNELLDDTKAGAIIAHLEARHGRNYAP